ncbi:hypothetical protein [Rhodococcus artemisiae]|uniref:Uncharacterized protein n=1 Tax=Rhodococcus artemisiae TaxID=714159 RepID=A0ABU7LK88_9NOCA|nr:hypothetical protein [Rhodococcus artemisiae]MEE2061983.1 hypothetical protein [Rhodococcus artemisiae]
MTDVCIYIEDRVVTTSGNGRAFVEAYQRDYVPSASARGMTLERITVSPPVWLDDESNIITITWTVAGQSSWWKAAIAGRHDPTLVQWWESVRLLISERTRSTAADATDIEELCNV